MHMQSKVITDDVESLQEGPESINKDSNSPLKIEKNEGLTGDTSSKYFRQLRKHPEQSQLVQGSCQTLINVLTDTRYPLIFFCQKQ